jgi:hypothetical protein
MKPGDLADHMSIEHTPIGRFRVFDSGPCNGPSGCRLVVTKERLEERWPENMEFRTFAAKLADAVQRALGEGRRPGVGVTRHCPLGCLPGAPNRRPAGTLFHPFGVWAHIDFTRGFDGCRPGQNGASPYYRLGQAYRRRFMPAGQS